MPPSHRPAAKAKVAAYEDEMNGKAIALFRQMVGQMNDIVGSEMVDPTTRQKVGASDIPEVILEQIDNFDTKWVKGGKDVKENATVVHGQFWFRDPPDPTSGTGLSGGVTFTLCP